MARKPWEPVWREERQAWWTDFRIEGRRVRRSLGLADKGSKELARQAAKLVYREEWKGHLAALERTEQKPSMPFWEAAKGYVDAGGEARFLPKIVAHFGPDMTIDEIGEPELTAAELDIYPHAAPDTRRRQVRVPVSAVIRWARGERRRPSTDVRRLRWLTPEEFERMLSTDRETIAKLAFLVGTGCRPGEMLAAEVKDLNLSTRQLWISAEETGAGKTPLSARFVRLPPRSIELMGERPEVGRLFLTPKGKPYVLRRNGGGQIKTAFDNAKAAAGLGSDVTPYTLRHTWATWFYAATRDFAGLMDQGGWAKADMALRYRKVAPDDLAERLSEYGWGFGHDLATKKTANVQLIEKKGGN
ncbi:MAG: tyrosine-type recombinase/integrase [Pseudomonadota bacterium]